MDITTSPSSNAPTGFGIGVYTPREAARLVGIAPRKLRRWIAGYDFVGRKGDLRFSEPVISRQLKDSAGGLLEVTFLDVIELLFIRNFHKEGVTLRTIKKAALYAAADLQVDDHPFSRQRFRTDGRRIFAQFEPEAEALAPSERKVLDVVTRQHVFAAVINPFLRQFEYGLEFVRRWWPLGKNRHVIVDPAINFGAPVLRGSCVPTDVVAGLAKGGEKVADIASWYEIDEEAVKDAIAFEHHLDA